MVKLNREAVLQYSLIQEMLSGHLLGFWQNSRCMGHTGIGLPDAVYTGLFRVFLEMSLYLSQGQNKEDVYFFILQVSFHSTAKPMLPTHQEQTLTYVFTSTQ